MDEEAAVMGHVTRSRRMMAEMFEQGGSILANMSQNRERIKVSVVSFLQVYLQRRPSGVTGLKKQALLLVTQSLHAVFIGCILHSLSPSLQ
jgi:hypothetical protein